MSDLDFRKLLLLTVIETYSPLRTPRDKRRFKELMEEPEHRQTREFRRTWVDHLTMIGLLEAKRSTLLRQISARFGRPADELVWEVRRLSSLEKLDEYLRKVLTAHSLEDMSFRIRPPRPLPMQIEDGDARPVSHLDEYRKFLMLNLVETLTSSMTPEEERQFKDATLKPQYRDKGVFRDTWAEEMMINGLLEGKRSSLLRQISARFGSAPDEVVWKVGRLESLDELDAYLDNVLAARSLEDMGLLGPTDGTIA